ncbi:hypothetical protein NFC81_05185 [Salinispirillum sp. LH 10-3-1]|uniref:Uncharacterized protein n=1 Tax=Salinispirillum sp. LH 10-3-1 TaxID=2952525 RepID=A0AB38YIS4_9GAMM
MTVNNTLGLRAVGVLLASATLTACLPEEDAPNRNDGDDDRFMSILVDASSNAAFQGVNLVTGETTTDLEGDDWHIALRRYNGVILNGGLVAGSGSVSAALAHEQSDFYDGSGDPIASTFINATAEGYLADLLYPYETHDLAFAGEAFLPAFGGWQQWSTYNHPSGGYVYPNNHRYWVLRSSTGDQFAVRLTGTEALFWTRDSSAEFDGAEIQLGVTPMSANGSFNLGNEATVTAPLGVARGSVYIDLDNLSFTTTEQGGWDIEYRVVTSTSGFGSGGIGELRLNGGVTGDAGVALQGPYTQQEIEALDASGFYSFGFVSDASGNAFAENEWFVYGIPGYGSGHSLAPNFRVFAVDLDGDSATTDDVYMVQAVNYYHPDAGTSGYITLRVRQLD